jgi:hypothetical protein
MSAIEFAEFSVLLASEKSMGSNLATGVGEGFDQWLLGPNLAASIRLKSETHHASGSSV